MMKKGLRNTGKYIPQKRDFKNKPNNDGPESTILKDEVRTESSEVRIRVAIENDKIDTKYGFDRVRDTKERTGYLINMHTAEIIDEDKRLVAAMDYYFIEMDGTRFKVSLAFQPYFFVNARDGCLKEVVQYLSKKYAGSVHKIDIVEKEDLDLPNHLSGLKQTYIKLSFISQTEMTKVRKEILTAVNKNKEREKKDTIYAEMLTNALTSAAAMDHAKKVTDHMENILDIREHDVPYHVRVSIDKKIFCGTWYTIKCRGVEPPVITKRDDIIERPEPIVLAFDIETTKLPLKFPDSQIDQIMMISYMIDGQGYLITNREIITCDVEDFEYTPKPEFEGLFTVFNEENERSLLLKFFDHIMDIKPHIFVTYNGDFFDWPFVEARAATHGLDMRHEIGFSKQTSRDGTYACRPAMHMDCLCWVKRDSYLPVGSQGLKAVAKAKLRYDPVELDPEDMCRMAAEQPQVLSNYSVSDAVATYYLYMKYVHPFIFALCTIIPLEPDEVLRKGSGTLCESLLMVEAFHANIIFPNKQVEQLNRLTSDGHVLDTETYVGGHVEALESGVFRADIPCRFRLVPQAFDTLIEGIEKTMTHAIEVEEGIPLHLVDNFEEVCAEIKSKLEALRDHPNRLENPVIYHLDVGAMYPNIILTNRLQPSSIVNSSICAVCELNKPGADCQRHMQWMWRGEMLPASRNEYQRIQQQLETEKFPPLQPGGPHRAFHNLSKEDQAAYEKKRLSDYCRVAYKKTKVTKTEIRTTTICQKENSFYVDTVRAFRDRRYEYKALNKAAKAGVAAAVAGGDAADVKAARALEVLYDSLQLAHKCILNSFYGYVMRRGARWHSMEMAGIVCYTGADIIQRARQIIEQVGRPLELDTDGIWCVLPASFPDALTLSTRHDKKKKLNISYPNAVLNAMVKDHFTNDQYFELVAGEGEGEGAARRYERRAENSIFFEVDGPYLGMVLPASKEEGKRLKKRYAVFNFDGTLAELKGFEVKRRGELQLIKIFQSSVFEAFLKGDSLEACYSAVAKVADYWLDVLYSKGANMPDSELFELISENRSMSKKLEDYGGQKSTSISTAKRLAQFLGEAMVKDAGLACRFIISRKPDGAPVTERAVPLAIFHSDARVRRHHLRRWLKDNTIGDDVDIRDVLDWGYYIERLSGAIQKIITIPAAMQGISNPVPRVKHPEWLHKKMLEKDDVLKQRRINEMFAARPRAAQGQETGQPTHDDKELEVNADIGGAAECDIEDLGLEKGPEAREVRPLVTSVKRKRAPSPPPTHATWREALGPPPPFGNTRAERVAWVLFQKKKWAWQWAQRGMGQRNKKGKTGGEGAAGGWASGRSAAPATSLGGFLRRAHRTLLDTPWQIIQIAETGSPGLFRVWALVGSELRQVRVSVARVFYVHQRVARAHDAGAHWRRCSRVLPRAQPLHHLYQYTVPEHLYQHHHEELMGELSAPEIEGIYETQTSLEFRALIQLGCVCAVDKQAARSLAQSGNMDTFELSQLQFKSCAHQPYLQKQNGVSPVKHIYLYQHGGTGGGGGSGARGMWALVLPGTRRALLLAVDTVATNTLPNLATLYAAERHAKMSLGTQESQLPGAELRWESRVEVNKRDVYRAIGRALQQYREEQRGPTFCAVQSALSLPALQALIPGLSEFPLVALHVRDVETLYGALEWQRLGARAIVRHYLNLDSVLQLTLEQCRYFHVPLGNMPADPTLFGADVFFARHLVKHGCVLWCSSLERPDLGGRQTDDNRLASESEEVGAGGGGCAHNAPGAYGGVCVELSTDALAVCALLQAHHILAGEGTSLATAFNHAANTIQDAIANTGANAMLNYDETAQCSGAFKILRTLVAAWLRDVSVFKNVFADLQISHLYRWLKSPSSLLYEPALHRTLYNLMKKLFLQLVAEFRRLGSTIVFANFNKLLICTKKHSVEDAIGYVEFVVQSIRNKELFHGIDITYKQCWAYLLWRDEANFAGVQGKLPEGLVEVGSSQQHSEDPAASKEGDEPVIVMQWSMCEALPTRVRDQFGAAVAAFVSAAHTQPARLPHLLAADMSQKLFKVVEVLEARMPALAAWQEGDAPGLRADAFPPGTTPALLFVTALCHVLALHDALQDEVTQLRRNLLRLVGVGEWSERAEWRDVVGKCVLSELICKVCNQCRDLDLSTHAHTLRHPDTGAVECLCETCGTAYDGGELEARLLDTLARRALAYTLQDLYCARCHQVKRENLAVVCNCAGDFAPMIPSKDVKEQLLTYKSIAKFYRMPQLLELIEFNLQYF